jgi:hypothetical protein
MELEKLYVQTMRNGDEFHFIPKSLCKNGSYKGSLKAYYSNKWKNDTVTPENVRLWRKVEG